MTYRIDIEHRDTQKYIAVLCMMLFAVGRPLVWQSQHQVPLLKDYSVEWQCSCAHEDILGGRKFACHGVPAQKPEYGGKKEHLYNSAYRIEYRDISSQYIEYCNLE